MAPAVVRIFVSHKRPGFESWRRRHMWVVFGVGSLPRTKRFNLALSNPVFPSSQ